MKTSAASALASLQRSARHFATQAEPLIGLKPGKPTREWLQSLRRLARRREQPEGKHIHAGLILERYPICLPENPGWKSEFRQWQKDWNAWKYKTAKPGWLDCSRPTTDDSDSVRIPGVATSLAACCASGAHVCLLAGSGLQASAHNAAHTHACDCAQMRSLPHQLLR